ncbi:hypothetical protein [Methanobrevibacter sp.]|uniref:phage terminase large subunit family protein n=1 Tax=Methanobrevibacter sp. TaxID=66852 RepID=UPI003890CF0F
MFSNIPDSTYENISKNLYCFYKKIIGLDYPDFTDAPHIRILADKLESLTHGEIRNLCVAMPPRHSKSSMVTLAFPLWLIWNNPNLRILIVNAESSLSETFGLRLREFIDDFSMLTGIYLSDDKHSSTHIKLADENGHNYKGSIRLVGVNGSITGHDADYLIIDDPYKGFEDITPTLLKKKIELFKTKIVQRREPDSKLIICHTRWHTNDLQGYLKENQSDTYEFLEFSAIKSDGESLWSARYTVNFLKQQLKEMGERLFSSIYQQKPLDETGDFFNLDNIYFDDIFDHKTHYTIATVRSWDLAYSPDDGDKNDSTAGILMHKINDNYFVINDLVYGQFGDDLKKKLKETAVKDTANIRILIETGTKGGAAKFLYDEYDDYLDGYITQQSESIGSKVDRATPFKDAINDGKIHIAITNDEMRGALIEQLKSFPLGTHDDIIDAMSYAYSELKNKTDGSSLYQTGNATY